MILSKIKNIPRDIKSGVRNLVRWFPVIWNDEDWDQYYLYVILKQKLKASEKVEKLKLLGVHDLIIDPGFGFGKTVDHNYQILKYLDDFKIFELPILVGLSRKSMINKLLEISPEEALNGTTALNTLALINGANILRVHDVKEAKETIKLTYKFLSSSKGN